MFSGKGLWTVGLQKERLFVRISVDFGHPNHHAGYTTMPGPCGAQLGSDAPRAAGATGAGAGAQTAFLAHTVYEPHAHSPSGCCL